MFYLFNLILKICDNNIPDRILTKNTGFFKKYFDIIFALTTRQYIFLNLHFFLKIQTRYAFFKNLKENSQAASMLPFLLKTFEKIMNKQISPNFEYSNAVLRKDQVHSNFRYQCLKNRSRMLKKVKRLEHYLRICLIC